MNALLIIASFVIIVAGIQASMNLVVPFLMSAFLAIVCVPPLKWLTMRGISPMLSITIIASALILTGAMLGIFVGASVAGFSDNLPGYQERLNERTADIVLWLGGHGIDINLTTLRERFDPSMVLGMAGNLLSGFGNVLANVVLIMLTVVFLLIEAETLPQKWKHLGDKAPSTEGFEKFVASVNSYLVIKTLVSLATGICVALWMWIVGVDYPLLWGLISFMFHFVPNIGTVIAAVPAILLAWIQLGVGDAALAMVGYFAINFVMGNFVETRYMGHGVGLSTLVVFISLVFWGWILGPVGMLLSVPLTMIVKLALEEHDETRWLAILLGAHTPTEAVETEKS